MRVLRSLLLSSVAAGITLVANSNAGADTPVAITYVPKSLSEASIVNGPWTLHQNAAGNRHDHQGVVPSIPTPYNPPTTAFAHVTRVIA